jgi:hypothetical protein
MLALVVIALFVLAVPSYCQEQQGETPEAEEYREEEFSPFLRDLRRAEIVMLGSFPLTLFFCLEFFDIYRYIDNGGDYRYAPWPFRPPDAVPYEPAQRKGVLLSALSASLLIAVADYVIARVKQKRLEP